MPPKKAEQSCLEAKQKSKFSGDFPGYRVCCIIICTAEKCDTWEENVTTCNFTWNLSCYTAVRASVVTQAHWMQPM